MNPARIRPVLALLLGLFYAAAAAAADDPYLRLAAHWAPDLYQDTWFKPEADYLTAFEADGDWVGANNLDHFFTGQFQPYRAVVYYSAIESETHYFLVYGFFHPVDYEMYGLRLIPQTQHENDLEGILVVVAKDGSEWGKFRALETLAHGWFNYYANGDGLEPNAIKKKVEPAQLRDGSHVEIYIQQGGHGPYELHGSKSGFRDEDFKGGTGVVYRYTGSADTPESPNDREVGYALASFFAPGGIWDHRCGGETFDLAERMVYAPPPGRPGMPASVSGCDAPAGTVPLAFDGDLSGLANTADAANPPWGWGNPNKGGEGRGVWAIDPAWAVGRHFRFSEPYSQTYIFNPYLGLQP